jgi:Tfp pilus assembly protein PilP
MIINIKIFNIFNIFKTTGLLIIFILLSGCEKNGRLEQLKLQVKQTREASAKNIAAQPIAFQLPASIKYQAEVAQEETSEKTTIKPYSLTQYSLSVLHFVGIIEKNNQVWAYIMTPDNITYQVKEGDKIGNKNGRIIKITADHINVLEPVPAVSGKLSPERIVTLKLKG